MLLENSEKTPLGQIGEAKLIELIREKVNLQHPSSIFGIGDDAALIQPKNMEQVITTDLLTEGVHFDLSYSPIKHLGYKAVVVNLSDIAAMGAKPTQILLSLALPPKFTLEAYEELIAGVLLACNIYKVDLVGGDTSPSLQHLHLNLTAIGEVEPGKAIRQNTAKANEIICVSGSLGAAFAGFLLLDREKEVFKANPEVQPDLEEFPFLLEKQLKPEARFDVLGHLKEANIPVSAMTDVSDGLASDLLRLAKASKLGVRLDAERIPIDQEVYKLAETMKLDPFMLALNGGEDYELLFTVPVSHAQALESIPDLHIIGFTTNQENNYHMVDSSGKAHPITAGGWDGFTES